MPYVRDSVRVALFVSSAALLAASACVVPPIAFHDGLPAQTLEFGRPEGSFGYQRAFVMGQSREYEDSIYALPDYNFSYLTPGARFGLGRPPLAAEVGLVSLLVVGDQSSTFWFGPEAAVGYAGPGASFVVRGTVYVVNRSFWNQVSLLAGSGTEAANLHYSVGGRLSPVAVGPVAVVGGRIWPVDIRGEASFMFPAAAGVVGRTLTLGLTVAAPARPGTRAPGRD